MKRACLWFLVACGGGGGSTAPDADACASFACPAQGICGDVLDLSSAASVSDPSLTITFHDALAYASDPANAPALGTATFTCHQWVADSVATPSSGFLVAKVDGTDRRTTVTALDPNGLSSAGMWTVLASTDQAWSQQAGVTDLIDQGADFLEIGGPGKDVTISGTGTAYYFSDSGQVAHTTIDPTATSTAGNGGVLLSPVNGNVQVSGGGPSAQLTSIPGALVVPLL